MIHSILISDPICRILKRQESDSDQNYNYTPSDPVEYLFKSKAGEDIQNDLGEFVPLSGVFITTESLDEFDRILLDGYEYEISSIRRRKDVITGNGYNAAIIVRRRKYNEDQITISKGTA